MRAILRIFRFGVLNGPSGPPFLLIFICIAQKKVSELCHDISVLLTAENVDRIGINLSILSIGFSARIVNFPNSVIVRIQSESFLLIPTFFLCSTALKF